MRLVHITCIVVVAIIVAIFLFFVLIDVTSHWLIVGFRQQWLLGGEGIVPVVPRHVVAQTNINTS
jgi:hypothetical protein